MLKVLTILLLALALPSWGQEEDRAAPENEARSPSTNEKAAVNTEDSTSSSTSSASPTDYRPSEQISEDLSVSFPVDI